MTKIITPETARNLAVSYASYLELPPVSKASAAELNSIACWGSMLLEAQRETGVELQCPQLVRNIVDTARLYRDRLTAGLDYSTAGVVDQMLDLIAEDFPR